MECDLCSDTKIVVNYFGDEINCPRCSRLTIDAASAPEERDDSYADFGDYGYEGQ